MNNKFGERKMRIIKTKKKLVEKNMKTKTNKKNIFKKLVENM